MSDTLGGGTRSIYLALAEAAEPKLRSSERAAWMAQLDVEDDNLRAALDWSSSPIGDVELGLRLVAALGRFWHIRGYLEEWERWLGRAIARDQEAPARAVLRARALLERGLFHAYAGTSPGIYALDRGENCAALRDSGDRWGFAASLLILGNADIEQGEEERGQARFEQSLAVARASGDPWMIAYVLQAMGWLCYGNDARAIPLYEESIGLARATGDPLLLASNIVALGWTVLASDPMQAAARFRNAWRSTGRWDARRG